MTVALASAALAVVVGLGGWGLNKVSRLGEAMAVEQVKLAAYMAQTSQSLERATTTLDRLANKLTEIDRVLARITTTLEDHERRLGGLEK